MRTINVQIREIHIRMVSIFVLGLIMPLTYKPEWMELRPISYWERALIATTYTFVFWNGCYLIIKHFRFRFPSINSTGKRLVLALLSALLYVFIANILLYYGFYMVQKIPYMGLVAVIEHGYGNYGITIFIIAIYEGSYFFDQWRITKLEAERLKTQQIRSQFEVLKNQVSPHFLFNSLNTLMSLIPEDPRLALTFTEKLSEVYRYILQQKDAELVSLQTELAFARSYIFLLQMRFEESLRIHWDVDEGLMESSIAPLTVQMLVENAVKHNIVSHEKPLTIEVFTEEDCLTVRNNLQKKRMVNHSTGIGLANIRERYRYLTKKPVLLLENPEVFEVRLPLIFTTEKLQNAL